MFVLMADHIDAKLNESQVANGESTIRRMHIPLRGVEIALLTIILSTVVYLLIPHFPSPQLQIFSSGSQQPSGEAK